MSVIMIILGSLITAVLGIGIVSGVILSVITVFRLLAGRGTFSGKAVGIGKRILLSCVCLVNVFALLTGGLLAVNTYESHKTEIWGSIEQQAAQDNIIPKSEIDGDEIMNEPILNDVMSVQKNISPLSVIGLIAVSLVGAVLLITLCTGGIAAVKKFWHRLFNPKD